MCEKLSWHVPPEPREPQGEGTTEIGELKWDTACLCCWCCSVKALLTVTGTLPNLHCGL